MDCRIHCCVHCEYIAVCVQTDEIRDNMEDAIKDYRLNSDDEDHDSDVNDAVENVQDNVRVVLVMFAMTCSTQTQCLD